MKPPYTITLVLSLFLSSACSSSGPLEKIEEEKVQDTENTETNIDVEQATSTEEPQEVVSILTEEETFQNITFEELACNNDLACFIDGVSRNWTTYYQDEVWVEPLPGVTYSTNESWVFNPKSEGEYAFVVTSENETPPSFEEGWFEAYARSAAAPAEIKSMIPELDAATFPTEEELAQLDEETRAAYELQMNSGKTASEVAWMSAAYLMETQLYSTIMGVRSVRYDCTSRDTSSLMEALQSLDTNSVLQPDEYTFLTCKKSYQF